jgi:Subtilase family
VIRRAIGVLLAAGMLAAPLQTVAPAATKPGGLGQCRKAALSDATVVAVIDFGVVPYHWDFAGSKMPQAKDNDPCNNLPLKSPPHKWLRGFPGKKSFDSYTALKLGLETKNKDAQLTALDTADAEKWNSVKKSTAKEQHFYWMPGTKVIGALEFGSGKIHGSSSDHGAGTTSVSVGNIHGTCPECLLMFIDINGASQQEGEAAINWAMKQPWIDVITNSYGFSAAYRDRVYSGSNVGLQRKATDRGQTIFFSAGNGNDGAYVVPNTTHFSSQEGPDWIVTVGAVAPGNHGSYQGHGRPADLASIGSSYPASYGASTVSGTGSGGFGGTSNATPTVAGIYARGLFEARSALKGPSWTQRKGVIARGGFPGCGSARKNCELRDGKLTGSEMRTRLLHSAVHSVTGVTDPQGVLAAPVIGEEEFLAEGHGSYYGLETGKWADYMKEFARVIDPMLGTAKEVARPEGEKEWMIVDSFCRQHLWGAWRGGYFIQGKTKLPGDDPNYPMRSSIERSCPLLPQQD